MHQLPPDLAPSRGVGRGVPEGRADDHRRAQPRVRVRARSRQRPFCRAPPRHPLPGRARQRLRHLAGVRQPVLAGEVPHRPHGANSLPPLRRGRLRRDGGAHSSAPRRDGETAAHVRSRPGPNRDPDAGVVSRLPAARAAREPGRRSGRRPRVLVPAAHPAGGQPRVRRALDGREANGSWPAPAHAFG